jgi:hypothetical protein
MTAGLLRLVWAISSELQPRDDAGQFVVQLLEALAVGFLKGTDDLLVSFFALRPLRSADEDPDRDVSRLYRRVVPVLQYLDPADYVVRKERPDALLDTSDPGRRHVIFLTCKPCVYNTRKP